MNRLTQYAGPYFAANRDAAYEDTFSAGKPQHPAKPFPDYEKRQRPKFSGRDLAWLAIGTLIGQVLRFVLTLVLVLTVCAACFSQELPAVPATAAALAVLELAARGDSQYVKFLWSPTASDQDFKAAVVALNTAISQTSTDYKPERLAGGALILVDLRQLVDSDDEHTLDWLLHEWDSLALKQDAYFSLVQHNTTGTGHGPLVASGPIVSPAPHLGDAGLSLGVGRIYRVDQFYASVMSPVDGGKYLEFRRLVPGKTTRSEYLKSRGYSLEGSESNLATDRIITLSDVTHGVRVVKLLHGQNTKPSVGRSLGTITVDVAAGPQRQNGNAFMSLLGFETDKSTKFFNEIIITLPAGYPEYTLWDDKQLLIAEAVPQVATDNQVPASAKNRLFCGQSCIGCHTNAGYKSLTNQRRIMLQTDGRVTNEEGTLTLISDISKLHSNQLTDIRKIISLYGASKADLDSVIDDAREALNRRYDVVAENASNPNPEEISHSCSDAYAAGTAVFNSYVYDWVTPEVAARELGFVVPAGKKAKDTLRAALPAPDKLGFIAEGSASTLGQLEAGYPVQRNDFEQAYVELESKAIVTIERDAAQRRAITQVGDWAKQLIKNPYSLVP